MLYEVITRVPVVLNRAECERLFEALEGTPRLMVVPVYTTLEVTGEAHQQHFIVQCEVPGVPVARGEGASRRAGPAPAW